MMIINNFQCKTERNKRIYEERKAGLTLEDIAKRYNLTKERVRQIALRQERQYNYMKYKNLYATKRDINNLKMEKQYIECIRSYHKSELTTSDKEIIQKIDNLIEVYSEL